PVVGDVDLGEEVDLLRLAVFEDGEVLALQVAHGLVVAVGDDGVHLDVSDLDREGDGGQRARRRARRCGRRGLRAEGARHQEDGGREEAQPGHRGCPGRAAARSGSPEKPASAFSHWAVRMAKARWPFSAVARRGSPKTTVSVYAGSAGSLENIPGRYPG